MGEEIARIVGAAITGAGIAAGALKWLPALFSRKSNGNNIRVTPSPPPRAVCPVGADSRLGELCDLMRQVVEEQRATRVDTRAVCDEVRAMRGEMATSREVSRVERAADTDRIARLEGATEKVHSRLDEIPRDITAAVHAAIAARSM